MKTEAHQQPLISIIVPIYNVEKYLKRSIESILSQTYTKLEILLVDDGSTDNSSKICDDYASSDSRIRVFHKKNGGLSDARNIALDNMTGTYVTFVDSDDYIAPDMIEKFWLAIKETEAEMITSGMHLINSNGEIIATQGINELCITNGEKAAKDIIRDLYPKNFACGKIYLSSLFVNIRYPKGRVYEDTAVTYRVAAKCRKVCYLPDNLYYYEIGRPGNITSELQTQKAIKSYMHGIVNCHERLDFIKQQSRFQDIRQVVIEHLHLWALLAMQSATSQNYAAYLQIHQYIVEAVYRYNDKPKKYSLRLALSSPILFYYIYKIKRILLKKQ